VTGSVNYSEEFNKIEHQFGGYYRVSLSHSMTLEGRWKFKAVIFRVDSGEDVDGDIIFSDSPSENLDALYASILSRIELLPKPPYQWGCLVLRGLLKEYRQFNNELTLILVELQNQRVEGRLTEDELHLLYWTAREKAIKGAVKLSGEMAKLSTEELVQLMTSPEDVYRSITDAYSLDDLDGRDNLFKLIADPSSEVIEAHDAHLKRWAAEAEKQL